MRTKEHVTLYLNFGLFNAEIIAFLALAHRIVISISTLKRTLRRLKLRRRKDHSDLLHVAMFINKLKSIKQQANCRDIVLWMHL